MLLMYSRPPGHSFLPIKLVSVVDGTPLRSIRVRLLSNDKVDFLELCNNSLLIKQKHHALQVCNIFDGTITSVPASIFKSPEVQPLPPRIVLSCVSHSSFTLLPIRRSSSFSTQGAHPYDFLLAHQNKSHFALSCFLTLDSQRIRVWDAAGACITSFEDHVLTPTTQVSCCLSNTYFACFKCSKAL
jgi:hypothetical protein